MGESKSHPYCWETRKRYGCEAQKVTISTDFPTFVRGSLWGDLLQRGVANRSHVNFHIWSPILIIQRGIDQYHLCIFIEQSLLNAVQLFSHRVVDSSGWLWSILLDTVLHNKMMEKRWNIENTILQNLHTSFVKHLGFQHTELARNVGKTYQISLCQHFQNQTLQKKFSNEFQTTKLLLA